MESIKNHVSFLEFGHDYFDNITKIVMIFVIIIQVTEFL